MENSSRYEILVLIRSDSLMDPGGMTFFVVRVFLSFPLTFLGNPLNKSVADPDHIGCTRNKYKVCSIITMHESSYIYMKFTINLYTYTEKKTIFSTRKFHKYSIHWLTSNLLFSTCWVVGWATRFGALDDLAPHRFAST